VVLAPASISKLLGQSEWGELDADTFLRELAAAMATELGCERFAVRLVMDTRVGRTLKTVAIFDRSLQGIPHVPDIIGDEVDTYLTNVARGGGLVAFDVGSESRMPDLVRDTFAQCGVRSLLDVAVSLNGLIYGTMGCEQVRRAVHWTPHQVELLRRLAVKTAPALIRVMHKELTEPGELWEPGPSYWLSPLIPPPLV
jgi:GAF domain-containing protein